MPPDGEPHTYQMNLQTTGQTWGFRSEGCRGRATTRMMKRVNFMHRHVCDTVIILEEDNLPHLQCPRCDMLVPWKDLNDWNATTAQCTKGEERKRLQLAEEEMRENAARAFKANVRTLDMVTSFKYLGRIMTALNND